MDVSFTVEPTFLFERGQFFFRGIFCIVSEDFQDLKEKFGVFLHPQELSYFSKLPSQKQQENYLLGRYAAKIAASLCEPSTDMPLTSMRIDPGTFCHPVLYSSGKEKIQVSISHCDKVAAALAFPESHPMGVDLEKIDQEKNVAIDTQLTSREKELLMTLSDLETGVPYTLFWTLKEALSKALCTGLLSPVDIYEIKDIGRQDNTRWFAHFTNFPQYQGLSFSWGNLVCSIVYPAYPKQLNFDFDVHSLLREIRKQGFLENVEDS